MSEYSFLDRLLHRLALQVLPVSEMTFEMDQKMVRTDPRDIVESRHVFVSGLARAGTTILMRRFYATGGYCSLTYRNMPFILAPNLWRKITQMSERKIDAAERAHGDRILVDVDSPESLDEVFWRVFDGRGYIAKTYLKPHAPDRETLWKFVCYVNAILYAQGGEGVPYLSKNNNNVLRLRSIRKAFPRALILMPFREPLAHAGSLLRQHRNFVEMQAEDRFAKSYMTWLAHHEFGLDHRPFRFDSEDATELAAYDATGVDHWLTIWCQTYEWLERTAPEDAIFVCYEDLCREPAVWTRLAELAEARQTDDENEAFSLSQSRTDVTATAELVDRASALYGRLVERAQAALQ